MGSSELTGIGVIGADALDLTHKRCSMHYFNEWVMDITGLVKD